jgi:hypothetical protein
MAALDWDLSVFCRLSSALKTLEILFHFLVLPTVVNYESMDKLCA